MESHQNKLVVKWVRCKIVRIGRPMGVSKIKRGIHITLTYAQTTSEKIPKNVGRMIAHREQK